MGQGLDYFREDRFINLLNKLDKKYNIDLDFNYIKKCFTVIDSSYDCSLRQYHNKNHIRKMLRGLDTVELDIKEKEIKEYSNKFLFCKNEVELAIWFHDLIYIVGNKNNELNSFIMYEIFIKTMKRVSFSSTVHLNQNRLHDMIRSCILATIPDYLMTGDRENETFHVSLIRDLDLLSFSEPDYETFVKIQTDIANEFKLEKVTEENIKFYENVLNMKQIYKLDKLFLVNEEVARKNLERFILELKGKL